MSKHSGIDRHSKNCVVAVIDDDARICCQKRVSNDLENIGALLEPHRELIVSGRLRVSSDKRTNIEP